MKIGLSATFLERSLHKGIVDGIGHYSKQIYEGVNKRNCTVVPFAFLDIPLRKAETKHITLFPRSYPVQLLGAKFGVFCPLSPPVDVFHVTDFRSVPMDVPVISTIHDAIPMIHPEWSYDGLRRILTPVFCRESAKYADYVVCPSEHAASDVVKYYRVPEEKICVIPCFLPECWKIPVAHGELANTLKKNNIETEYILTVGTLQPRKNIEPLVDAFLNIENHSRTKDVKLVIIGKPRWRCESLLNKIRAHRDKVIHLSNIDSDEDLRAIYQGAKAFAYPSLYEGFGLPVLEAFASNIPPYCFQCNIYTGGSW